MKLFFISLVLTAFSIGANCQLTKKTWLVGGSGTFYSYKQDQTYPTSSVQYKYTNIGFAASIGYFLFDKFSLGLRPGYSLYKGHWTASTGGVSGGLTNTKRYSIGPFVRYYILNNAKPFNILADINYQLGKVDFTGESGKMNSFSSMAGPVIFFNTSIGLEVLLGYIHKIEEIKNNFKDERNGFQISIGLQIHLEKD